MSETKPVTYRQLPAIRLGSTVVVSDPCYNRKVWCRGELHNVLEGTYIPEVFYTDDGDWGVRVRQLQVHHQDIALEDISEWTLATFEVGVDSGQAGIFDDSLYPTGEDTGNYGDNSFYGRACKLTLGEEQCGTIEDRGVVSSSGFGDGSYDCYYACNADEQIIAIKIVFIGKGGA